MSTDERTRAPAEQKPGESSNKLHGTAEFREVRKQELSEIKVRRSRAQLTDADPPPGDNLVGLALSGGGIRSAAFSLGVVHALSHRGVMPFIDYLSTVSGGGYAGAFLSSYVLGARKNWRQLLDDRNRESDPESAQPAARAGQRAEAGKDQSPHVPSVARSGLFPKRMLQFLFGGNYLRRTWLFFNRYLIGLLLIWAVTFSGLIAAASGVAYVFRTLDGIHVRSWLAVLGFDGDIRLAFFLTSVLLIVWLAAWAISYFRSLARAEGNAARHVFYFVVVTALVGSASLLLSGHIALSHGNDTESVAAGSTARTLWTVVISAIGASLIPYLTPKALLRSGANPKNSAEKYTFWIASRALVYGVPFLVVAYFAQENISGYNATRDSRLTFSEILNWDSAYAPLFLRIEDEWKQCENKGNKDEQADCLPGHDLHLPASDFRVLDDRFHDYYAWLLADDADNASRREKNELGSDSAMLAVGTRWWHFAEYCLNALSGGSTAANPTTEMVHARDAVIEQKGKILDRLNKVLSDSQLYRRFEPALDGLDADRKNAVERLLKKARGLDASQTELKDEAARASANRLLENAGVLEKSKLLIAEDQRRDVIDTNRALLGAYYPNTISPRETVYSSVVLSADQAFRLQWFLISACVFLVLGAFVDLNATSWHAFYSRQMANMWIEPVRGAGPSGREIALAALTTSQCGWPYHLISGALQLFGKRRTSDTAAERQSFLFSELYCGTDLLRYAPTDRYMGGDYSLADAIAISGAAVSPIQSRNPLVTALLFIFNIRLGQWVANPSYTSRLPERWAAFFARLSFTPLRLLSEMGQNAEDRSHCFVTDGGHYENLGIEPLLRRRCKLIIASDAGQDGDYDFVDFMRLIRWARINQGIEFAPFHDRETVLNLAGLIPDEKTRFSSKHFLVAKILYPPVSLPDGQEPKATGYLVYLKSSLCKDDPWDLLNYRRVHVQFPHDETSDQFYDPDRFFCYWQLGKHVAEEACANLPPEFEKSALSTRVDAFIEKLVGLKPSNPARKPDTEARDRAVRDLLERLDPVHNASSSASAELGPIARDVLGYLGRHGLDGLPADSREMVLGPLLKEELFRPEAEAGAVGRLALERLTTDQLALAETNDAMPVRCHAIETLGVILQLAKEQKYLRLAHRINSELEQFSNDPDPNIQRVAKECLKEQKNRRQGPRASKRGTRRQR